MIRKILIVALLGAAFFGMVTQAGAQTPTATPTPPKASATATPTVAPVVAPPKAAAPAPAKTGNAGLADPASRPAAATAAPADVKTLGVMAGLVASLVAAIKGVYPGTVPSKWVPLLVVGVSVAVLLVAFKSAMLGGTTFDLLVQGVGLVTGAMGSRELLLAVSVGRAGTLPTNG